jgi:hypothetical protein
MVRGPFGVTEEGDHVFALVRTPIPDPQQFESTPVLGSELDRLIFTDSLDPRILVRMFLRSSFTMDLPVLDIELGRPCQVTVLHVDVDVLDQGVVLTASS